MNLLIRWFLVSAVLAAVSVSAMTSMSAQAAPADHTFGIIVEAHCNNATSVCGATSEADFKEAAQQSVYDLNVFWRNTGISFQLNSVTVVYGDSYLNVKDDSLDSGEATELALLNTLRTKALNDPHNVYWFVLQNLGFCFSGIPGSHLGSTPDSRMPNEYYGVFCSGVDGMTMGHEIGHHFCLAHPFTQQDSTAAAVADHDGDKLNDTAEDPGEVEYSFSTDPSLARDAADVVLPVGSWCTDDPETCATTINDNREWCAYDIVAADAGSIRPNFCTPRCRKSSGGTVSATSYYPDMELLMSYYKHNCSGPLVYGFQTYEAFSPDQVTRMRECFSLGTERGQLDDLCVNKGGDSDWDGLCDMNDPCPHIRASTNDGDMDSDGIPDACDPCPIIPAVNSDNDKDGIDDACDTNDDNDACNDLVDEHPDDAMVQVGSILTPGCSQTSHPIRASESADTDLDGIPDCRDDDNDGDGLKDVEDPCPNIDGDMCVIPGESCGMALPWDTCLGGGCNFDIWAKLNSIRNPDDPRLERKFDVKFKDDSMYLLPAPGYSAAEIRGALTGKAFGMLEANEKIQMTLVKKSDGSLVADVGTYRIGNARIAGGALGNSVEVAFGGVETLAVKSGGSTRALDDLIILDVGLTWGVGIPATEVLEDTDEDGIPDATDNCVATPNRSQTDADNDHIGNACDPDFDQDGVVTEADIDRLSNCQGVLLENIPPFPEPGQPASGENLAVLHHRAIMCRFADLNNDGTIDGSDASIADAMLGKRPGPSGLVDPFAIIDPNPDQTPETASDNSVVNDTIDVSDTIEQDTTTTGGSGGGCSVQSNQTGSNWIPAAIILLILFVTAMLVRRRKPVKL